jgi:hypothetical protein
MLWLGRLPAEANHVPVVGKRANIAMPAGRLRPTARPGNPLEQLGLAGWLEANHAAEVDGGRAGERPSALPRRNPLVIGLETTSSSPANTSTLRLGF